MSACSKCGEVLETRRADLVTSICWDCRDKLGYEYCCGCRSYGIKDDRCFVCRPDPTWAEATAPTVRVGGTKVYKDECPCGIKVALCTYHAQQAG